MNAIALTLPPEYVHVGNPIPVSFRLDIPTNMLPDVSVVILKVTSGVNIQTLSAIPDSDGAVSFNISEKLSLLAAIPVESIESTNTIFKRIVNFCGTYSLRISVVYVTGAIEQSTSVWTGFKYVKGAINSSLYGFLKQNGKSIFTEKYFNNNANYFLTTRTAGKIIQVRETELKDFAFFANSDTYFTFKNTGLTEDKQHSFGQLISTSSLQCYYLDIEAIRQYFYYQVGHYPNVLEVTRNGGSPVVFAIIPSAYSVNNRLLRFLNSYDVWDSVELSGEIKQTVERDENLLNEYNSDSDSYTGGMERSLGTIKLMGSTGYKNKSEMEWLKDFRFSSYMELLLDGRWQKVILKPEEQPVSTDDMEPGFVSLSLELAQKEMRSTPYAEVQVLTSDETLYHSSYFVSDEISNTVDGPVTGGSDGYKWNIITQVNPGNDSVEFTKRYISGSCDDKNPLIVSFLLKGYSQSSSPIVQVKINNTYYACGFVKNIDGSLRASVKITAAQVFDRISFRLQNPDAITKPAFTIEFSNLKVVLNHAIY